MSVFDLDQKGQQALAEEARLNPLDASQIEASAFTGTGKGVGMGLMKGGARVGQFVGMAGAVVPMAIDKITEGDNFSGKSLTDSYFEGLDKTVHNATDYWTPRPTEVGKVGQVLGGLSEIVLPLMAGGGNPTLLIGSQEMGTATDLVRQGVDADTAAKAGLLQGGATAIGFRLPAAFGNNLAQRLATGAGVNLAIGLPQRGATSMLLDDAGHKDLAKAYGNTPESAALDVLTGLVFGGLAHVSARNLKPSEVDAVLTANNARHFQQDTAPGIPADPGASALHQSALETAIDQLVKGERVNVADSIHNADFVRPPQTKETPVAAAIREAYGPDLTAPRGIRNNNPGNIEIGSQSWQGQVAGNDPRFATFETPEAGIRALAKNLITYQDKHGLNTVESIINRWAPAKENQTGAYVQAVAKEIGVKPSDPINVRDPAMLSKLASAIIRHENGQHPYTADQVRAGVDLALYGGTMKRATDLSPEHKAIETASYDRLLADPQKAVDEYFARFGKVIDPDNVKKMFPDFNADPSLAAAVHEPSSYLSKLIYAEALRRNDGQPVIFTAGGGGSGKSEARPMAMAAAGLQDGGIVFDSTLSSFESARAKIDQALESGAPVAILYTNKHVEGAFRFAMGRDRVVRMKTLANAHVGASNTIRELADYYRDNPNVAISVVNNHGDKSQMVVGSIDDVFKYDHNEIERRLYDLASKAHESGSIDTAKRDAILAGYVRQEPGRGGREVQPGQQGQDLGRLGERAGSRTEGQGRESRSPLHLSARAFPLQGREATAVTERGSQVQTKYVAVEADSLVTSHDNALNTNPKFPQELQPRDRARDASEAQIAKIENAINPELLADSPKASDGAPIIGKDKIVESGNARTIALRRAYDSGKAEIYRDWLESNADRFGLDPAKIATMKRPVLARVGLGKYDRAEFARQANESAVAQMSVTESAKADAARMPDMMGLVTHDDGQINIAQSMPFIRAFIANVVSPSEHGLMITADGAPSQQGLQRVRNAVFAKAYGDPEVVAMMAESTDANVKNILGGMMRAAPGVARLKDLIEAGARYPVDITGDLVTAVRQFSKIRADGMTVDQFLAQQSLFDSGLSPEVNNLLIGLQENARAPKRVAEMIGRVVDAVDQLGDPRQVGMFDSMAQPKPRDLIADAVETLRAENDVKQTGDLFKSPEFDAARQVAEQSPDMRVVLEDGSEVSVREALDRSRADMAQADVDVKAFDAAVTCFLRTIA